MWLLCWRCGWRRYEWFGWGQAWSDRFRCFWCRCDALDAKYGPSLSAELMMRTRTGKLRGVYFKPQAPSRYQLLIGRFYGYRVMRHDKKRGRIWMGRGHKHFWEFDEDE